MSQEQKVNKELLAERMKALPEGMTERLKRKNRPKKKVLPIVTVKEDGTVVFNHASTDARRFEGCIKEEHKAAVLDRSNKKFYGPSTKMGTGALMSTAYNLSHMKATAEDVVKTERGACHTFAQLGAYHLLQEILEGKLPPTTSIKVVSFKDGLGSHTFLLVDYKNDDLDVMKDENKESWFSCLIVDLWAVAMGHHETNGVFNIYKGTNAYPYLGMLTNLELVYDSAKDKEFQSALKKAGLVASHTGSTSPQPVSPPVSVGNQRTQTSQSRPQQEAGPVAASNSNRSPQPAASVGNPGIQTLHSASSLQNQIRTQAAPAAPKAFTLKKNDAIEFLQLCYNLETKKMTSNIPLDYFNKKKKLLGVILMELKNKILDADETDDQALIQDYVLRAIDILVTPRSKITKKVEDTEKKCNIYSWSASSKLKQDSLLFDDLLTILNHNEKSDPIRTLLASQYLNKHNDNSYFGQDTTNWKTIKSKLSDSRSTRTNMIMDTKKYSNAASYTTMLKGVNKDINDEEKQYDQKNDPSKKKKNTSSYKENKRQFFALTKTFFADAKRFASSSEKPGATVRTSR